MRDEMPCISPTSGMPKAGAQWVARGGMSDEARSLEEEYRSTLLRFIEQPSESLLLAAYDLGRAAVARGLGVIWIADIHHRAARTAFRCTTQGAPTADQMHSVEAFFLEALSPFEMVHRAHADANTALHKINDLLEEEARRIAHTLHAEAGQLLASAFLDLATWERDVPEAGEHIARIRSALDQMHQHLRRLSHELRPPILDDLGLIPALRFLADGFAQRTGLAIKVESNLEDRPVREAEVALYRIAQEALSNISRHAQATHAQLQLHRNGTEVRLSIQDDGTGFDVAAVQARRGARGVGLIAIQERLHPLNGTFQIESASGKGTKLVVTIPVG
jgi:signal transduction histidine kinase